MHDLSITIEEILKSRTIIQEFNLKGQRAIGMILLNWLWATY